MPSMISNGVITILKDDFLGKVFLKIVNARKISFPKLREYAIAIQSKPEVNREEIERLTEAAVNKLRVEGLIEEVAGPIKDLYQYYVTADGLEAQRKILKIFR